jgi:hypothetical protein
MKHRYKKRVFAGAKAALFVSLTALLPIEAFAKETNATKLLKQMSDYVGAQQTISASFDAGIEIVTNDLEKIQFNSSGEVFLARPDKLRVSRTGGYSDVELMFDGATVTLMGKNINVFSQVSAPGSTDQLLDRMRNDYDVLMPGSDLLLSDVFTALSEDIVQAKYIGTGVIGRIECDHLAFRNEDADWQLWIESGGKPIPRKLVITNRVSAGAPQYTLHFRDWKTDAAIAPNSFAFTAPSGAKKLEMQEFARLSDLDEVPAGILNGAKQ